jgi:hypothetical protein
MSRLVPPHLPVHRYIPLHSRHKSETCSVDTGAGSKRKVERTPEDERRDEEIPLSNCGFGDRYRCFHRHRAAAHRVSPAGVLTDNSLSRLSADGSIEWNHVTVSPNLAAEFPKGVQPNRYYAARETASSPLRVQSNAGEQQEKFLFYRGVSASRLPISARLTSDGKLVVESLGEHEIPNAILFERRNERVGYRVTGPITDATSVAPPVLNGNVDSLYGDLEEILVGQGLYRDEAHAMVETWKDSWFEEGSRLIYIVPGGFIDTVLPLTIDPMPGQIVRVFIGRIEIVTPATAMAVRAALTHKDEATLDKYGRFLEPILQTVNQGH